VRQGNVAALLAAKDHVSLFLYDGAIVPDPEGIITGGHENTTARTIALGKGQSVNASALSTMLRQIIANNRAGGGASSRAPDRARLPPAQLRAAHLTRRWAKTAPPDPPADTTIVFTPDIVLPLRGLGRRSGSGGLPAASAMKQKPGSPPPSPRRAAPVHRQRLREQLRADVAPSPWLQA
jgi:hypothetical protein